MKPSEDCVALVMRLESWRGHPYRCPGGRWTIGYGMTYWPDGTAVDPMDQWLSPVRAEALLRERLAGVARQVSELVGRPLTQGRLDALVMLVDNIGIGAFQGSTLLRRLRAGDFQRAAAEFPRWNKSGGKILPGLTKRRKLERALWVSGTRTGTRAGGERKRV